MTSIGQYSKQCFFNAEFHYGQVNLSYMIEQFIQFIHFCSSVFLPGVKTFRRITKSKHNAFLHMDDKHFFIDRDINTQKYIGLYNFILTE